jgi:flagellar motor switch protein FliG
MVAPLDNRSERAFDKAPADRVGAILTLASEGVPDGVIKGLEITDPGFAKLIRNTIFTFRDISNRLLSKDVYKAIRPLAQSFGIYSALRTKRSCRFYR